MTNEGTHDSRMTQWHVTQEGYKGNAVEQITMQTLAKLLRVEEVSTGCSHNTRLQTLYTCPLIVKSHSCSATTLARAF